MALFESYERRIDQINAVLNSYGIASIEEAEKIAVVGINGTGKSTLLKIVANLEHYEGAPLLKKKDLKISYLPQNPQFNPSLTILEQMHESLSEKEEDFEIKAILGKLGIFDVNEKIGHLSGGQKKRVALALALLKPSDLLILDEPTNHLDSEMIEWLEKYLIKYIFLHLESLFLCL